jgi:hypothetical protein
MTVPVTDLPFTGSHLTDRTGSIFAVQPISHSLVCLHKIFFDMPHDRFEKDLSWKVILVEERLGECFV